MDTARNRTDNSRRGSLTDRAYEAIQDMIVTGTLASNQLISESDLCRDLDIGRTPVREALQRLMFEGFVDILPRRGILVSAVDVMGQLELLEARRPLEAQVITLAAMRATDDERTRMRELADQIENAVARDDRPQYQEINKQIHRTEAAAAKNRYLRSQIGLLHNLSRRFWYSIITERQIFSEAGRYHAATLRAIADKNPEEAVAHNSALLALLARITRAAVDDRS